MRLLISASLLPRLVASRLVLLGGIGIFIAASAAPSLGAGELKWGRPTKPRRAVARTVQKRHDVVFRDAAVVAAVWAEDDQYVTTVQATEVVSGEDRSVVVRRSSDSLSPPVERLARLPDDPFDQEFEESDFSVEDPPLEEVEEAIEQEIDSREDEEEPSVDDLFGNSSEESEIAEDENFSELFGEETGSEESEVAEEMVEEVIEAPLDDPFDEPIAEQMFEPAVDALDEADRAIDQETEQRIEAGADDADGSDLFDELMERSDGVESPDLSELFDKEMSQEDSGDSDSFEEEKQDIELDIQSEPKLEDLELEQHETEESDAARLEREESVRNCEEEIAKVRSDKIDEIDPSIYLQGEPGHDFPYECRLDAGSHQTRQWPQITYNWKAAALCHKPLYFEQVHLERYGHSWGPYVQPIMSGVHFFGTLPILPYKMGIRTPTECVYTLGYYRPGSCAPYLIDPVPFTWRAAFFEAGFATGAAFAIP